MSTAMLLIIGLCTAQAMTIIFFVTRYRKWISMMNGMLISMSLGMSVGILMGTILGIALQGNFFESTMYSIIIGLSVGFLAGLPIGLPAVIDGMLSGLMGGMMGAMLGEMMSATKPDATIKLLSFIVTMILLLILHTAENVVRKQSNKPIFFFLKYPFLLIILVAVTYIGLNYFDL